MAKRIAGLQISKDGHGSSDDEPSAMPMASAETMAKRKILKPKGRSFTPNSGLRTPSSGFGAPVSAPAVSDSNATRSAEKDEKLKALANRFVESVTKANQNGVPDLRQACEKYLEYAKPLFGDDSSKPASFGGFGGFGASKQTPPETAPSTAAAKPNPFGNIVALAAVKPAASSTAAPAAAEPAKNPFAGVSFSKSETVSSQPQPQAQVPAKPSKQPVTVDVDSDSESEDEKPKDIKIAGPSFSLSNKPTIKNLPFSFGKKPEPKKADSDSESEIEIKGPTFTFNKKISDPVFQMKTTEQASSAPAAPFSFGAASAASKPDAAASKPEQSSTPAFNFGNASNEKPVAAAPFSFGAASSEKPPAFSFGTSASNVSTGSNTKADAPAAFSFGAAKPSNESSSKAPMFGQPAQSSETEKPKPFSFGAPSESKTPTFNFGSTDSKPASSESKTPAFNFGSTDSKPASSETKAPAFNFGASDSKSTPFLFGSSATDSKPAFLFGNSAKPAAFSFGQPAATPSSTTVAAKTDKDGEEAEAEAEVDIKFAPVASLGDKKIDTTTGEENETVVLEQRAKLMLFDSANTAEPYKNMGVGDLKVLKSKEGSSSRILLRADGALRVLLNAGLAKAIEYKTMGNGSLVRVPVAGSDGKITTYVLKVKTAADGENLAKILNETKN
ncbi:hypothetical protein PUMCH_002800 [Australozyma saopauloensis]|uniref:RanBD1 domain-containing protein n=1 Tax=Australozyma saopauloensis TaxID=291208 RepID=A0AAX4HAA9_9ASCO|nr:hypothetical protein PUMCH_002800 [[Candida] saopauloensis]